jgi:hypothetical protein
MKILQKISILLILMQLSILMPLACRSRHPGKLPPGNESSGLRQICPEAWYKNLMPGPGKNDPEEYLIVNGSRAEVRDFDQEWIRKNCSVKGPVEVH